MTKCILLILFCGLLLTCQEPCYYNSYLSITEYEEDIDLQTAKGIQVTSNNQEIDLIEIDRQVDALENCLNQSIRRECFRILVAPDWYISKCSGQELFPCRMPIKVCEDKDIIITEECPCNCRAIIQDENIIIVTPNLYLLRAELARMVTGINNPWIPPIGSCLLD